MVAQVGVSWTLGIQFAAVCTPQVCIQCAFQQASQTGQTWLGPSWPGRRCLESVLFPSGHTQFTKLDSPPSSTFGNNQSGALLLAFTRTSVTTPRPNDLSRSTSAV